MNDVWTHLLESRLAEYDGSTTVTTFVSRDATMVARNRMRGTRKDKEVQADYPSLANTLLGTDNPAHEAVLTDIRERMEAESDPVIKAIWDGLFVAEPPLTLAEIGRSVGLSKESVRLKTIRFLDREKFKMMVA